MNNISIAWQKIKTIFSLPHTEQEYQYLVETLDNLIDEIGENENHELWSVMETIGILIEHYEYKILKWNKEHL
jgi:HTH-type transcriptional regulator/antitoxin HigA